MVDTQDILFNAQLAEKAERYDDMVHYTKLLATAKKNLDVEERNLLSVAYKNSIVGRRSSWRVLQLVERRQRDKGNEAGAKGAMKYRTQIEAELKSICADALSVLEQCATDASATEDRVFYSKMKGDYHRYVAEFAEGDTQSDAITKGKDAYEEGKMLASDLGPTHPIRLGLALNDAVFHYEILENTDKACTLAQDAFDAAANQLENIGDDNTRDSTLIMQMLKDNLALWKTATRPEA
eukprot:GHVO01015754.1.p1 GENE.GHVO01015754.1~~GHVO01015754.1.p1  ORF type:complete len:238 (-),score=35.93 GHVO01015754.1:148-861(-)